MGNAGGGARLVGDPLTFENCAVIGNRADGYGGGIQAFLSSALIANCTIVANGASQGGGGVALTDGYSIPTVVTLTDSIVWDNVAPTGPEIALIYESGPDGPDLTITYSDIRGGVTGVRVDPLRH
jgi:hypothetical protein